MCLRASVARVRRLWISPDDAARSDDRCVGDRPGWWPDDLPARGLPGPVLRGTRFEPGDHPGAIGRRWRPVPVGGVRLRPVAASRRVARTWFGDFGEPIVMRAVAVP